ncbi:hypothetical protein FLB61_04455 [Sellimonas caecigallum]|uniref:Uncharacterized protein n=1 Tax=Sellimonas caecigallum TaxID=2592333 RepID=A0ABS7L5P9_9FIRM|nr:hypothetical protein [Sellimonas caecigallum]
MRNVHSTSFPTFRHSCAFFRNEAPVGNSVCLLNQRELSARDSLSLLEADILLTHSQLFSYRFYSSGTLLLCQG